MAGQIRTTTLQPPKADVFRYALLLETLQSIAQTPDLNALLRESIGKFKWLLDFDRCTLALLNADGQTYQLQTLLETRRDATPVNQNTVSLERGIVGQLIREREPFLLRHFAGGGEPLQAADEAMEGGSLPFVLAVSLQAYDTTLGALTFGTQLHRGYRQVDIDMACMFATHLALAIDRGNHALELRRAKDELEIRVAERTAELRNANERLNILREIDEGILAAQSPHAIGQAAMRHIRELVPCRRASVVVFDYDADEAVVLSTHVDWNVGIRMGTRIPLEAYGGLDVLGRGEVRVVEDILAEPQPSPMFQMLLAEGLRSFVMAPLIAQGELLGSLNMASDVPSAFTSEHVDIARDVAAQIAVALQHARLFEQAQRELVERQRAETERIQLLRRLVTAQEEERRRVAHDLHDQMGQHLSALMLGLKGLEHHSSGSSPTIELVHQLQGLTDQLIQEVRRLAWELRPAVLDNLGLSTALRRYAEEWSQRCGVGVDFHSSGFDDQRLPPPVETALYRVVQEALTNVLRHAHAQRVSVLLERHHDHVLAIVEDDGQGFDAEATMNAPDAQRRLGLLGMQERVALVEGTFEIESTPGGGATVFVRVPLTAESSEG
jgi:signal transduction histidine kinase